jgi:ABC-type proline/glycine betaine transport system permease subunit
MNSYWSDFVAELAPGLTAVLIALIATLPPYVIMRRSRRGRARSAVAYLCGFLSAVPTTTILASVVQTLGGDTAAVAAAGLLISFFGPFAGIASARWVREASRPRKPRPIARDMSPSPH